MSSWKASLIARASAGSWSLNSNQMVSPTALLRTVVMLSQLTMLSWSGPLRGPTRTSLVMPRIVLVIVATVTQVNRWSRVAPQRCVTVAGRAGPTDDPRTGRTAEFASQRTRTPHRWP